MGQTKTQTTADTSAVAAYADGMIADLARMAREAGLIERAALLEAYAARWPAQSEFLAD